MDLGLHVVAMCGNSAVPGPHLPLDYNVLLVDSFSHEHPAARKGQSEALASVLLSADFLKTESLCIVP